MDARRVPDKISRKDEYQLSPPTNQPTNQPPLKTELLYRKQPPPNK